MFNDSELKVHSGRLKDHKSGRKYRALVNGNVGPIANLSEIRSLVLNPYAQEMRIRVGIKQTVNSTEDLFSQFETNNPKLKCNDFDIKFICSMDKESLFRE